ncbi:MAG TPA: pantetheine-phosphate adenylyltransferase [Flavobacteriales bacterium]|nr:pantetheine-phosphate adenylyltransferase [Flavobacteriales bacterium]HRN37169.1 pantetheine-phosphate adenylyltransferase [Flavobacteriales bacterium]HRO39526.1 pantetheine-phosphate adenylyltransferase [Flavobacteriales bacterium]HRP81225.1 pantetheine-phosphate adenylyltransferase [Flavobacteriales bacterium]HRQ83528.1 pantetheine-phosphate adenylyltransferase [Flavobacteriales bacterium]
MSISARTENRIAVFPGSFDPVTIGHVSIVERALPLFDRIVVAIGVNNSKHYMFPLEQRLEWLRRSFQAFPNVETISFEGLTADLCMKLGAQYVVRGLRNSTDHGVERSIALMNHALRGVETIFLPALPEHAHISSTIVRELMANKADVSAFVPAAVRP